MPALELIAGQNTDPADVLTAVTPLTGDSFTLRSSAEGAPVRLLQIFNAHGDQLNAHAVRTRVRSPLLHDNVQGISVQSGLAETASSNRNEGLLNPLARQRLTPQDTLTVELAVSVLGGGGICHAGLLVYYDDLPGVEGTFITPEEVLARAVNFLTVENTITALTDGQWGTAEAINAETDLLRANTPYAILGYSAAVRASMVRYRATAWGNLGIGGPIDLTSPVATVRWFSDLSKEADIPLIPVFNSADRANVLIDIATHAAGASVPIFTHLVQLSE
ncbi:hypothetical protein ES708_24677 [subsurface metagenome]